MENDIHV